MQRFLILLPMALIAGCESEVVRHGEGPTSLDPQTGAPGGPAEEGAGDERPAPPPNSDDVAAPDGQSCAAATCVECPPGEACGYVPLRLGWNEFRRGSSDGRAARIVLTLENVGAAHAVKGYCVDATRGGAVVDDAGDERAGAAHAGPYAGAACGARGHAV